jgi:hypothetical protein
MLKKILSDLESYKIRVEMESCREMGSVILLCRPTIDKEET